MVDYKQKAVSEPSLGRCATVVATGGAAVADDRNACAEQIRHPTPRPRYLRHSKGLNRWF
jgi:hypothetical protein